MTDLEMTEFLWTILAVWGVAMGALIVALWLNRGEPK